MPIMWDRAYLFLFGNTFRTVRTIFLAVALVHIVYFVALPRLLTRRKTRSPGLRRYLEWVVATPSLFGDVMKIEARHDLMRLAHMEGLHEQAAAQGFAILRHKAVPAGMAAEVRGRLADALEGLGRYDEAKQQRGLGESTLDESPDEDDPSWYINRGRQLAARRDHAGACRAYEAGLEHVPEGPDDARALLTLHLCNALFSAGRIEESALRAEEAAGLVNDPERRFNAHRQAGVSFGSLGRLDEAAAHKRRVVELAESMGDPTRIADSHAELAEIQRKRGQLAEALAACDRAAAMTRATRQLEMVRYEILRSWGHFDEALAAIRRAGQVDPNPTPRAEQTIQAVLAYARASILMELGKLDEVPALLKSARDGFRGDAKLSLWNDSAIARLAALQGHRDAALAAFDRIEPKLGDYAQDRNTRSTIHGNLGRAALALGEYDRAVDHWQGYLDLPPQPVDAPVGHYHLAEAHRGHGDIAEARASYLGAVATGLDTHHARLAQSRLRSLGV